MKSPLIGMNLTQLGKGGGEDARLRRLEACKILANAYSQMLLKGELLKKPPHPSGCLQPRVEATGMRATARAVLLLG